MGIVGVVSRHLEPVPDPPERSGTPFDDDGGWDGSDDDLEPLRRPAWWRWVAVVVVIAMVVATPVAYALYLLLR
jgi:hypothetical protein